MRMSADDAYKKPIYIGAVHLGLLAQCNTDVGGCKEQSREPNITEYSFESGSAREYKQFCLSTAMGCLPRFVFTGGSGIRFSIYLRNPSKSCHTRCRCI